MSNRFTLSIFVVTFLLNCGLSFAVPYEQETLNVLLRHEAKLGWVSKVEALLKQGANINAKAEFGETALYYSIFFGRTNVALRLLELGADPNIAESSDVSPLMKAATHCNHRIMRELLKRGAKVNHKDSTGRTAIINASDSDCLLGVATILSMRKGQVDLDAMDESFQTARDYAHNPWIKTLLENARSERPDSQSQPFLSLP